MLDSELLTLDRDSPRAYYRQIAAGLRAAIESGALAPDERLPPARELAGKLGVNFNTVARAYRRRAGDGVVEARQGRGTVVRRAEPPDPGARLEAETLSFLGRMNRLGYTPQEVRWEFAAAIRAWIQEGEPPGAAG